MHGAHMHLYSAEGVLQALAVPRHAYEAYSHSQDMYPASARRRGLC